MKKARFIIPAATILACTLFGCGNTPTSSSSANGDKPSSEGSSLTSSSTKTTSASSSPSDSSTEEKIMITALSITNKEALEKTWYLGLEQTVEISLTAAKGGTTVELSVESALEKGLITIKSNEAAIFAVAGLKAKALAIGSVTLVVEDSTGKISDSVALKAVERTANAACIVLTNASESPLLEDETYTLPSYKAYLADGTDVSGKVSVSDNLGDEVNVDTETFVPRVGAHILTYSLPLSDEAKITKDISFRVYKRIIGTGGGQISVHDEYSDNPYLTVNNNGIELEGLYLAPSKLYYAEATFEASSSTSLNNLISLAHMASDTKGGNSTQYLYNGFKINSSGGWEGAHKYNSEGWDPLSNTAWETQDLYAKRSEPINFAPFDGPFTLGIARDGGLFHFFINGIRAYSYTSYELGAIDTLPALVFAGSADGKYDGKISNFVELAGDEAKAKIDSSLAKAHADYYGAWDGGGSYSSDQGFATLTGGNYGFDATNGFSFGYNDKIIANGNQNLSMVTPFVYMDGSFELSYKIKINALENGGWGKLYLDLRTARDRQEIYGIDTVFGNLGGLVSEFGANYYMIDSSFMTNVPTGGEIAAALGEECNEGIRVKIRRDVNLINGDKFTFTISKVGDETKSKSFVSFYYAGERKSEPLLAFFKSEKCQCDIMDFQVAALPYEE